MKQGKVPTRAQKQWLSDKGLNSADWFVVIWSPSQKVIQNRSTREVKTYSN